VFGMASTYFNKDPSYKDFYPRLVHFYPIYQPQFMKESELRRIQLSTPGAYRITVPMRFIKELGIESGDYLRFTLSGKKLSLEKE
jgi:hypothetical protein